MSVAQPQLKDHIIYKNGDTWDIIRVVLFGDNKSKLDTKELAKDFKPTKAGLKKLWNYVRYEYNYKEDPAGVQWIQSPARLHHTEVGDCKSKTIFVNSILQNLGLTYDIVFISESRSAIPTHVYTIAFLPNGEEVIIDTVYNKFNKEPKSIHKYRFNSNKIRNYDMTQISYLSGIGKTNMATQAQIQQDIQKIKSFNFATATESERQEILVKEYLYLDAIWNKDKPLAAAESLNTMAQVQIKNVQSESIDGVFDGLKQRIIQSISRIILPKVAPFFLYSLVEDKYLSTKARQKKIRLTRIAQRIAQATGMNFNTLKLILINGIKAKLNKTPLQIVQSMYKNKVGSFVAAAGVISTAIGAISGLISAIKKVFRNFKSDDIKREDAPSESDFINFDYRSGTGTGTGTGTGAGAGTGTGHQNTQRPQNDNNNNNNDNTGGSNNTMMLVLAAAGIFFLSQR